MSEEKKFKIEHNKPECIGCGACIAVAPDYWVINDDGKADIKKGENRPDGWQERDITDKEFKENMEAAQSCPVNVIHIKKIKENEKLI